MFVATTVLVVVVIVLGIIAYRRDRRLVRQGLGRGITVLGKQAPILIIAFLLAAYMEVLIPPELIKNWLGTEAGIKSVIIASLLGGMIPSGPYVAYPIITAMYDAGASLATAVAFITGWMLWSTSRLPFELALFGPRFTGLRMLLYLIFPPLAGVVVLLFLNC